MTHSDVKLIQLGSIRGCRTNHISTLKDAMKKQNSWVDILCRYPKEKLCLLSTGRPRDSTVMSTMALSPTSQQAGQVAQILKERNSYGSISVFEVCIIYIYLPKCIIYLPKLIHACTYIQWLYRYSHLAAKRNEINKLDVYSTWHYCSRKAIVNLI